MKLDIVMTTYNRYDEAANAIFKIKRTIDKDCRLIIVDDGSNDARIQKFGEQNSDVYWGFKENEGLGAAMNFALNIAETDWIVYVESDCLVYEDWIDDIKHEIKKLDDNVAWMGFKVVKNSNEMAFFYRNLDEYGETRGLPSSPYPKHASNNGVHLVDAPCNVISVFNKKALDNISGPDPKLRRQWIDADLGMQFKQAGYKCIANGHLTFTHLADHITENQDVSDYNYYKEKWKEGLNAKAVST